MSRLRRIVFRVYKYIIPPVAWQLTEKLYRIYNARCQNVLIFWSFFFGIFFLYNTICTRGKYTIYICIIRMAGKKGGLNQQAPRRSLRGDLGLVWKKGNKKNVQKKNQPPPTPENRPCKSFAWLWNNGRGGKKMPKSHTAGTGFFWPRPPIPRGPVCPVRAKKGKSGFFLTPYLYMYIIYCIL